VTDSDVAQVLAAASPEVGELARRTRELVRAALPADVIETVDGSDIGYGWTRGYKGLICVISVHSRWVNLGFADGASLPDPEGLSQGAGKRHRFVRIATSEDLERHGLRELLGAARDAHPRPADRQ
jgi:hypothetical protein